MSDLTTRKQEAIEALAIFDDPAVKAKAGVMIGFKVPYEVRDAMRAIARDTGINWSAGLRRSLIELLAEAEVNGADG